MGSRVLGRLQKGPSSHEGSIAYDDGWNQFRPDKRTWICKPCRTAARRSPEPLRAEWRAMKRRGRGKFLAGGRPRCPSCQQPMEQVPWRARLRRRWWRFKVPWR